VRRGRHALGRRYGRRARAGCRRRGLDFVRRRAAPFLPLRFRLLDLGRCRREDGPELVGGVRLRRLRGPRPPVLRSLPPEAAGGIGGVDFEAAIPCSRRACSTSGSAVESHPQTRRTTSKQRRAETGAGFRSHVGEPSFAFGPGVPRSMVERSSARSWGVISSGVRWPSAGLISRSMNRAHPARVAGRRSGSSSSANASHASEKSFSAGFVAFAASRRFARSSAGSIGGSRRLARSRLTPR